MIASAPFECRPVVQLFVGTILVRATNSEQWYRWILSAPSASILSSSTFLLDSRGLSKLIIVSYIRRCSRRREQRLDKLEAYLLPVGESNDKADAALKFTLDLKFAERAGNGLSQYLLALQQANRHRGQAFVGVGRVENLADQNYLFRVHLRLDPNINPVVAKTVKQLL